jgi:hypothetical protein
LSEKGRERVQMPSPTANGAGSPGLASARSGDGLPVGRRRRRHGLATNPPRILRAGAALADGDGATGTPRPAGDEIA